MRSWFAVWTSSHRRAPSSSIMQAIVYGIDGQIASVTRQRPVSRPGHVLVKVEAVGLNPVDAKFLVGDKLPAWTMSLTKRLLKNCIIGLDFCGVVQQDSQGLCRGDRVYGDMPPLSGSLAEYILAPVDQLTLAPRNLTPLELAALPLVGLTALQALSPHVTPSSQVLIVGASGGTGHVAIQVAAALGAHSIVGLASASSRDWLTELCPRLQLVDYHDNDWLGQLERLGPFDIVLDCVTSDDARDRASEYPRRLQGVLTDTAVYRRLGGPMMDWAKAGLRRITGMDCFGREDLFWIRFPSSSRELAQLRTWAEENKLRPVLASSHPFSAEGVRQAFAELQSRRVKGKVVIDLHK